ncbi:MAG: hypothetical protein V2A66_09815 [Pseudomonadota bacterium]
MVEKVDRPEAPNPYQITRAKDAKEDQHKPPDEREDQEKRYKKQIEEKEWSKFDRHATTIKPVRVARDQILRCLFRGTNLRSGVAILSVDVHWRDGRKTPGALILLSRLEDFIRLKKFLPGQEVPDEFWGRGPAVELGIIQAAAGSAVPEMENRVVAAHEKPRRPARWLSAIGLTKGDGRRINWGILVLYIFLFAVVAFGVVVEMGR